MKTPWCFESTSKALFIPHLWDGAADVRLVSPPPCAVFPLSQPSSLAAGRTPPSFFWSPGFLSPFLPLPSVLSPVSVSPSQSHGPFSKGCVFPFLL